MATRGTSCFIKKLNEIAYPLIKVLNFNFRVVDMDTKRGMVTVKNPNEPNGAPKEFTFDSVYDWKYVCT